MPFQAQPTAADAPARPAELCVRHSAARSTADAFVNLNGLNLALDFNVAFPKYDPAVRNELGKVRGCYANFQTRLKFKSYRKSYEFEDHFLVPVTFESNGCPGASTMAFLADVKRHLIQTENKNPKVVGDHPQPHRDDFRVARTLARQAPARLPSGMRQGRRRGGHVGGAEAP